MSWPAGRRACECRLPELCPPTPHSPDRDECSEGPNPCSHSCHNAPGRFSCSCPAGFALARDDRNCRGEWARGQKLSLELGWVCAGHSGARNPARTHLRTWPVLAASDARQGVATPCFHWEFPATWAADRRDASAGAAREPRRHTCGHPVPVVCTPAEPRHGLGGFPATPWPLPADWGWK